MKKSQTLSTNTFGFFSPSPYDGERVGVRDQSLRLCFVILFALLASLVSSQAADKKIIFVAGRPSHGPGEHEHRAGCLLLKSCLDKIQGVTSVVYSNGWPNDPKAFDGADTIVIYA